MEIKTYSRSKNVLWVNDRKGILDSFLSNSKQLGNDSLNIDRNLFIEAASKENVQFEFMRLNSFRLNKKSLGISNARNAIIEADYGVACNGKIIVDTEDRDVFLTIFLAETLHVVLPASRILYSMDDLELIKGKPAVDIRRGIASTNPSGTGKAWNPSSNSQVFVYVIEDL